MAQQIHRIEKEFIFKTLMESDSPIAIHFQKERHRGRVKFLSKTELSIELEKPDAASFKRGEELRLFFRFRGTPITCVSRYIKREEGRFVLEPPEAVYRDLSRLYERVEADSSMSVTLLINGERLNIDFPASESYYEPEPPSLDLNFDVSRISDLLRAFRERSAAFASENKITMFRERRPDDVVERMLALSGKIIVLPFDNLDSFTMVRSKLATSLLKEDDLHRMFREAGEDPMIAASELQDHLNKLKTQKVWHELYCPVLFREFVVGYIYLMRADMYITPFSQEHLDMVHQFSRLLSYSLKLNGYFKAEPVKEEFSNSELVDISGSGLLFSYPLDGPSIQLYTDVELTVTIGDHRAKILGRVVRKFRDAGQVYLGVQFMDLSDADQHLLLGQLYGEDYDGQIEQPVDGPRPPQL
jgi:hypothetical protein